jgi:glycosidase
LYIIIWEHGRDGKVDHMEWEKNKHNTVYKNMDDYITVDEATQKGVNWEEAPAE